MSTTRGQEGGFAKAASPTKEKGATPFFHTAAAAEAAATASSSLSNERNPLIDDLFDDLRHNSFLEGVCVASHLQGESASNYGSFSAFGEELGRASAGSETSYRRRRSSSSSTPQLKEAVDTIRKTSQHFVHAMQVHELEDFFSPTGAEKAEDVLRRQLCSKDQQEVIAVVVTLVELLEEVRKARGRVASLTGELSLPNGLGRNRACSNSMASTVSTASLMRPPVHETNQVAMAYDQQGNRMINCYKVIANLGSGAYGKVKLGADVNTGQMVAIKMINKKLLKKKIGGLGAKNQEAALKREIAIMKKVRHRNCVSLYEVIDDPDSNMLYLIMEYVPNGPVVRLKPQELGSAALESIEAGILLNGEICNKTLIRCAVRQSATGGMAPLTDAEITSNPTVFLCKPLSQHICAVYLRQLVSGLRYMHKRHLVHHDIKPDNILLGTNHRVFLTDFGVSEILSTRHEVKDSEECDDQNRGNASCDRSSRFDSSDSTDEDGAGGNTRGRPRLGGGTLLFTAPELFDSSVDQSLLDPHLTDVWALGVTLYCMLVGMSPFSGNSYAELRKNILTQAYPWCGKTVHEAPLAVEWRVVLKGLLAKDPAKRWSLARLKSFLDQESFQDAMRQSTLHEAPLRRASSTYVRGDALLSSTAHRASFAKPLWSVAPATGLRPSLAGVSMASCSKSTLPPSRVVSSFAPVSALSTEPGSAARGFAWDLSVSEQEVREATRKVRVEVMRQRTVLSPHARAIVRRYVDLIRASLLGRNFIPLSHASPLGSTSCVDPPVYVRMPANPSKSSSTTNCSCESVNSPRVPVLAVAAKFHQTSEAGPISARSLFHPVRRSSRPPAQATVAVARPSGSLSASGSGGRAHADGNVANHNLDCRLQSLDAILSIVNLQSNSDVQSAAFTLSSSASSRQSLSSQRGRGGRCSGRGPGSSHGVLANNSVAPSEYTQVPGSEVAATAAWPKVQAPSTVAHTMIHDSATSSVISEEDGRQRAGANGNKGRLMKCPRPKSTLSGTTLSGGLASDQATLAPKSRSTATPLQDSVLYSASSCTGDSTSGGYPSTSASPNAGRAVGKFPSIPSRKAASSTPSPGFLGGMYPVEPAQKRLCDVKVVDSILTSYEEVPYMMPSKRRAAAVRKGA
ncbi:hypothetical protein LSCM4_01412 [Leishmania orientalis]|uniref:non-specific serine/threonine protein kinase n=1 Tax=Leishmania orientalis TaxID=2249476 RepID=A0A836KBL2_9TRYP|nr:hypothetical protein LSCM4_01412 [Leishmania orientalis]